MLQVSLWHTDLKTQQVRVKADRKNPDPEVIALTIGHELTLYMDTGLALRVDEALKQILDNADLREWIG